MRALAIDRDRENLLTVCSALEAAGWSCEGCAALSEAEPLLAGGGIDVVVADWETVFFDDENTRARLRLDRDYPRLILLSRDFSARRRLKAHHAGCVSLLRKPLQLDSLRESVMLVEDEARAAPH